MPGFIKVVVKKDFVGVVFEKQWQAVQAANQLKVTWKPGPTLPPQASFYDHMRKLPSRDTLLVDSKDVDATLAKAAQVVRSTYLHPYHMHGSIGASCAVADVKADSATVWSPTQGVYPQRDSCAMVLGMKPQQVKVIYSRGSGCYGINGADTVSYDAALLSQAVGRPVRVQLSRKDEMAHENFGLAFVVDQRVGLDSAGNIIAWDYEAWSPIRGGRPGHTQPGNQVTGFLAGFAAGAVRSAIAGASADRTARERLERRAVVRHRALSTALRAAPAPSSASACSRASSSRRSGPARSVRRTVCRTRSRTNA